jgi:hypothetical protein
MAQHFSSKAFSYLSGQENLCFYGTEMFIAMFTKTRSQIIGHER